MTKNEHEFHQRNKTREDLEPSASLLFSLFFSFFFLFVCLGEIRSCTYHIPALNRVEKGKELQLSTVLSEGINAVWDLRNLYFWVVVV